MIKYLLAGLFFGFALVKAEVISWFRIQEMFRLDSFHMYGVLMVAIATAFISIRLLKGKAKALNAETISVPNKEFRPGQIYGGLLFGLGWGITGACPGPLYALLGSGYSIIILTMLSAIAGTWVYGLLRERLP